MNDNFQYLLTEEEDDSDNKAWSAAYLLLIHIVNFTDINQKLSKLVVNHPRFVKFSCGVIQQIGSKYPNDDTFGGGKNKTILDNLMTIMHNVAQTGAHAVALRSAHVVEVFIPYLKTNSDDIKIYALSVLAELMDENEAKSLEANHKSIEYFLGIFNEAVDSDDGRSSDGWSSGELAHVVRQIARNDVNKKTLVNLGCLAPLEKLAMSNDMKEKREAARAIWTLSFDEENQVKMVQEDSGTVDLLLELHRQTDRKVKKASNGALWNMRKKLNESEKYSKIAKEMFNMETKSDGDQITRNKADGHVMISYQWGNQKLLIRIKECLRRNNIKVWMDVDDMQGSTLAAMARAVEEASIVLVCFSKKYKDSDNCRAEAEYAFQQKKTIIPLKMELGYKPDGWLGFIIGTKLFFDFSGKYPFEHKVEGLVKEIQSKLNRIVPTKVNNTMSSEYTVPDEKVSYSPVSLISFIVR
ncbi:hypothetical protein FSP39_020930 [Pinctada imbricata]|uniref:TIR domain-containing protein n=1 Tax=Pinctada imbricata TaxID=66713 RepID=A0AA88YF05_PINIB|nr:hypothetical protein FSP39_020930 [Pinctada imbricata]